MKLKTIACACLIVVLDLWLRLCRPRMVCAWCSTPTHERLIDRGGLFASFRKPSHGICPDCRLLMQRSSHGLSATADEFSL